MPKTFSFCYTVTSSMTIDVKAETEEEAWDEYQQMQEDGDIDYSRLESYESKTVLVSIDNKTVNPPKEEA